MNQLEENWKNDWSKKLNNVLINLIGEKLGYIPLENLTDGIFNLKEMNRNELIPLMVNDGLALKIATYQNGEEQLLVYVK